MDNLINRYKQLLTPVQGALQSVGNAVSSYVTAPITAPHIGSSQPNFQPIQQAFHQLPQPVQSVATQAGRLIAQQPLIQLPGFNPPKASFSPTIGQYAQGQLVKPFQTITSKTASIPEKLISTAQLGFNATPMGTLFNVGSGAAAGAARSLRTGQDFNQSVKSAISSPATGLGSTGLGIRNPFLTAAVDIAAGNPKGVVKGLTGIKGAVNALREVSPRVNNIHPEDLSRMHEILDVVRSTPKGISLKSGPIFEDAQRLAAHYLGQKWAKQPIAKIAKAFEGAIDLNAHLPQDARAGFPSLGLVGKPGTPPGRPPIKPPAPPAGTPPPGAPKPQGFQNPTDPFYNVQRSGTAAKQQLKTFVEDSKPAIEKVVGKPLTNADVIKRAQVTTDEIIKTIGRQSTEELGAAQLRLRQTIAQMADQGTVSRDLLEKLVADKSFAANNARLLQQRVITADPQSPQGKLMTLMLTNILKINDDLDGVVAAAKNVNFDDPGQATAFYRQFIKPSVGDWADKLRYNSMLSSPLTQVVNVTSNLQGTGLLTPIQKTVEGGIDAIASAFVPGRERTRLAGEGLAYAKGYGGAVKEAWTRFADVFKGSRLGDNPDLHQIPLTTGGLPRLGERAVDFFGTSLEAFDQLFMALTEGGLNASNAYRAQRLGKASLQDVGREASDLLYRGDLVKPGAGMISNAIGAGGEWVKAGTFSSSKLVRWTAKLTLPFVNIGTNLAKMGSEYNPVLGSLNMVGNGDKVVQSAKIVIGGAVTAMAVPLAMQDRLTFGEPTTPKQREAFRAAGLQPYSVKIGDNWYQYSKMHPALAFQLATVAALTQAMKEGRITEDTGARIANGAWNSLRFIADATYFKNVGDFVSTVDGDVEGLSRLASNYANQFVPFRGLVGWVNRMIDTAQRKPDTSADFFTQTFQQMMSQIPGASQGVPARMGPDGQPIQNQHRFINAVSPVRVSTENPQGVEYYQAVTEDSRQNKLNSDLKKLAEKAVGGDTVDTIQGLTSEARSKYDEELAKAHVKATGTPQTVGGYTFYLDKETGTVKSINLAQQKLQQADADYALQADRLKRANDVQGWLQLTQAYVKALQDRQVKLDPKTAGPQITQLQNKMEDLQAQLGKYQGQGGFTKPRKPKKVSVRKIKAIKVKAPKVRAIKARKVKAAKVYRLKSVKLSTKLKRAS